ncbi:hypothetical protein Tcan_10406 [Toxocara canis]|uniref:Globin family profile domain-containing protein n=1 Tax=Toxocara canis TaxID=6265 RepID=A0A0B2VGJ0_TOXCA|nr:hypothetical protein Tcan_10406 [Toxocara canis]
MGCEMSIPEPRHLNRNTVSPMKPSTITVKNISEGVKDVENKLFLNDHQKELIEKHWKQTLMLQKPDIFYRALFDTIASSSKAKEVLGVENFNNEQLAQWPKLKQISGGHCRFFEEIILTHHLANDQVFAASEQLGRIHAAFRKYGVKPHFLDIWRQLFQGYIEMLKFENADEARAHAEAWSILQNLVVSHMNVGYADEAQKLRRCQRGNKII